MASEWLNSEEEKNLREYYRLPVDSWNPGTYWIVSLDRESQMPSERELAEIVSYREYKVRSYYFPHVADEIFRKPLPADCGHNTLILKKDRFRPGRWFYRRMSWRGNGPIYLPYPEGCTSLLEALDAVEYISPEKWQAWKRGHAEIFSAIQAAR